MGYLQSLRKGEFKTDEFDFFQQVFGERPIVIFDVGANRGSTVNKFIAKLNYSLICAFEPNEKLFDELKSQFSHISDITLFNVGISNQTGNLEFNVNKGVDTSSFLSSSITGLSSDSQVETIQHLMIPVTTLDEVVTEQQIDFINLLKLDIQGSELNAFKGAQRLLSEKRIDVIYTEAYFIPQYVDQPLFPEIVAFLSGYGYQLQDIYNPIYGNGKLAWCDAVFVREGLHW